MRRLEFLQRRVREGVLVEDAQDFARYVTQSGICDLMTEQPQKGENPKHTESLKDLFPYDGQQLYNQARMLELACCEYWAGHTKDAPGTAIGANKSDLEGINHMLGLIAGRLAALEAVKPARIHKPKLRVVKSRAVGA